MRFLLITEALSNNFEPGLIEELKNLGINVEILDISKAKELKTKKYDLIYSRVMPYENCGFISYYISKAFEVIGNKFVDPPDKILNYQNKFICYELLKTKIPMAKTKLLLPKSKVKLGRTKIIKPIFGRAGHLVEKLTYPKLIALSLRKKQKSYFAYPHIIQDYIKFDQLVRVCILNKKPIFAITSKKKGWKDYIYQHARKYEFDKKLLKYSTIAARELNLNICFLDFFKVRKGYIFNEFNYCCDLPDINKILGYNFHKKVAKFFIKFHSF